MKYVFEWDPAKDRGNQARHGISFRQATPVFRDPLAISIYDDDHSLDEERWVTVGQTKRGVLLIVVHTFRRTDEEQIIIRLISVRRATRQERRQHEEGS
ncbi:MAG: BrnT family toxin [bacterium]|nr:BrnT family toxin [bacterium]